MAETECSVSAMLMGLFGLNAADKVPVFQRLQLRKCTAAVSCCPGTPAAVGTAAAGLVSGLIAKHVCTDLPIQISAAGDQRLGIGMHRIADDLFGFAVLCHPAPVHNAKFIGQIGRCQNVVADEN